jgi:NIMA (never in mitosis gene a)-related kinase
MQRLSHPNIVGFRDSFTTAAGANLCIVMTFCDGGDLGQRIAAAKGHLFKEDQIMHWFVQVRAVGWRLCFNAAHLDILVVPCR